MSYNIIPDAEVDIEAPVTEYLKERLRDNPIGIVRGDSGTRLDGNNFEIQTGDVRLTDYEGVVSQSINNTSYYRRFGYIIPFVGVVRMRVQLSARNSGFFQYGLIYINGVPSGSDFSTSSATAETFTQDYIIDVPGSTLELYCYNGTSGQLGDALNFEIFGDQTWQFVKDDSFYV